MVGPAGLFGVDRFGESNTTLRRPGGVPKSISSSLRKVKQKKNEKVATATMKKISIYKCHSAPLNHIFESRITMLMLNNIKEKKFVFIFNIMYFILFIMYLFIFIIILCIYFYYVFMTKSFIVKIIISLFRTVCKI